MNTNEEIQFSVSRGFFSLSYRQKNYGLSRGARGYSKVIPYEIRLQGDQVMLDFAKREIDLFRIRAKEVTKLEEEIQEHPILIATEFDDGTPLEGRIFSISERCMMKICLDRP